MSSDVEPWIIFGGARAQCFSGGIISGQILGLFTKKPLLHRYWQHWPECSGSWTVATGRFSFLKMFYLSSKRLHLFINPDEASWMGGDAREDPGHAGVTMLVGLGMPWNPHWWAGGSIQERQVWVSLLRLLPHNLALDKREKIDA